MKSLSHVSKFLGRIKPYPEIVVDKFTGDFRYGFITHEHSDHLVGLAKYSKKSPLSHPIFFATKTTSNVLKAQKLYEPLKIRSLEMNKTTKLQLESEKVSVTPLPANHVPGSCMYLFEGKRGNVLHTGDFRISVDELRDTQLFKDGILKPINYLYLDKTFWKPESYKLPPAVNSKGLILSTAIEWLDASGENVVYLLIAYFGYVDILRDLYNKTGIQINVNEHRVADKFKAVKCISNILTDESDTRIFVKDKPRGEKKEAILTSLRSKQVRMVMVSTFHFVSSAMSTCPMEVRDEYNLYWINHSLHCSQKESERFIAELKPGDILS